MGCGLSQVDKGYLPREEGAEAAFLDRPRWVGNEVLAKEHLKIAFFESRQYLTRGAACEVLLGYHTALHKYYCMHFFHKRRVFERKLMPSLQKRLDKSTFLAHLYGFATPVLGVLEDPQHIVFLSEFQQGGDLHMLVERTNEEDMRRGDPEVVPGVPHGLPEGVVKFYAAEIAVALHLLHAERHAVFCDLKPKNIAIAWDGHIRLVDSGSIRRSPGLDRDKSRMLLQIEGKGVECTTDYAAPELLRQERFCEAADWWSFGSTVMYLLTGDPPFRSTKHGSSIGVTARAVRGDRSRLISGLSPEARDLLIGLLRHDPERRLTFEQVREHVWFRGMDWRAAAERRLWPPLIPRTRWRGDTAYFVGRPQRPPMKNIEDYSPMAVYGQASHLRLVPHVNEHDGYGALPTAVARHFLKSGHLTTSGMDEEHVAAARHAAIERAKAEEEARNARQGRESGRRGGGKGGSEGATSASATPTSRYGKGSEASGRSRVSFEPTSPESHISGASADPIERKRLRRKASSRRSGKSEGSDMLVVVDVEKEMKVKSS